MFLTEVLGRSKDVTMQILSTCKGEGISVIEKVALKM